MASIAIGPAALPVGVPAELAVPIGGDIAGLRLASQKFHALSEKYVTDYHKYMGAKDDTVFQEWSGRAHDLGVVAFGLARTRVDKGSVKLKSAGQVLSKLATRLETAKQEQADALMALALLKEAAGPPTGGAPISGAVDPAVKAQVAKLQQANDEANSAHQQANAELEALTMAESFPFPPRSLSRPLQAIVLEKMVSTKQITAAEAAAVAGHMSKLSKKDGRTFYGLIVGAKTEKQRSALYKGLDKGLSMTQLSGIVNAYVNPLAHAHITQVGRIDQGVDYKGSGEIGALGDGVVTEVSRSAGWPGGGYVQYKLTSGPYAGKYVYYAENVTPVVHVGEVVHAGQPIVKLHGGMEMGFAAGPGHGEKSWAAAFGGGYVEGQRTGAGDTFSHLLQTTGAPHGLAEGRAPVGHGPSPSVVPPPHHVTHHAAPHHQAHHPKAHTKGSRRGSTSVGGNSGGVSPAGAGP